MAPESPRWLDDEQQASWRAFNGAMHKLRWALECRLSHLIKRLELRQLVRREPDSADGRYTNAILTRAGLRLLTASAPAHVAKVRDLVIDALTPAELRQLRTVSERIL